MVLNTSSPVNVWLIDAVLIRFRTMMRSYNLWQVLRFFVSVMILFSWIEKRIGPVNITVPIKSSQFAIYEPFYYFNESEISRYCWITNCFSFLSFLFFSFWWFSLHFRFVFFAVRIQLWFNFLVPFLRLIPSSPYPGRNEENYFNFYFLTYLWCLKMLPKCTGRKG